MLRGMFPALLTPFDADGGIIEPALAALIDHNIDQGMQGFYAGGSTSEALLMAEPMRHRMLDFVAETVARRVPVIANVGCISTQETVSLARRAEAAGYDAVSFVPPYYYGFSLDEIRRHTLAVGEAVSIPVVLYNIPSASGVTFELDAILEMLEWDFVAGVKHTSHDLFMLERMKTAFPGKSVFVGHDEVLAGGLALGGDGGIGSTYTVLGPRILAVRDAIAAGDFAGALAHQRAINDVIQTLIGCGVLQGLKTLLPDLGLEGGVCRAPFKPLTEAQATELRAVFHRHFGSALTPDRAVSA
ncbi:MAG: N-acetylneuraminate lyase [Pseudomonadota bacterium]